MSQPFLGQIQSFGFNFAPRNWALCNGQLIAIAQNTALFSLLGTMYGGNGQTTFALPDLRGRIALSQGSGPGLTPYVMGEVDGIETVTLISTEMPAHLHTVAINASSAGKLNTTGANNNLGGAQIYTNAALDSVLDPGAATSSIVGNSQPHPNIQPTLTINWCICTAGLFPARN
jgi:microcystin-dependent protein